MFIIVAQIFTNKLKNNTNIKGIKVSGVDILLSLFADDTDIFLEASIECVEAVFSVLAEFGINSGCKGNIDKTTCIPLGKARSNSHLLGQIANKNYGQDFIQNTFTALGINFSNSMSVTGIMEVNYEARITKANHGLMFGSHAT